MFNNNLTFAKLTKSKDTNTVNHPILQLLLKIQYSILELSHSGCQIPSFSKIYVSWLDLLHFYNFTVSGFLKSKEQILSLLSSGTSMMLVKARITYMLPDLWYTTFGYHNEKLLQVASLNFDLFDSIVVGEYNRTLYSRNNISDPSYFNSLWSTMEQDYKNDLYEEMLQTRLQAAINNYQAALDSLPKPVPNVPSSAVKLSKLSESDKIRAIKYITTFGTKWSTPSAFESSIPDDLESPHFMPVCPSRSEVVVEPIHTGSDHTITWAPVSQFAQVESPLVSALNEELISQAASRMDTSIQNFVARKRSSKDPIPFKKPLTKH